jgi:thiol:disulfide interchange protein
MLLTAALAVGAATNGPYDPAADGWQQIQAAAARAAKEHKRVLVVVGGNWCPWCRALDRLMTGDAAIRDELASGYELVHLNYSKENKNPLALAKLGHPNTLGFPALVVLSPSLTVIHTQESGSLETPDKAHPGHDPGRVLAFLRQWDGHAPAPASVPGRR